MGIDNKYGQVKVERGTIADDEPVVVFRSQDSLLVAVLDYYLELCSDSGSPEVHLDLIRKTTSDVVRWQASNFTKIPESQGY